MNRITMLILIVVFMALNVACNKKEIEVKEVNPQYSQSDVRNRNLKDAIENFNQGYFRAANSSLYEASSQRLRDEDLIVLNDLKEKIEEKTDTALKTLDSLAVKGKLYSYDFEYNTIHKNFEISTYRQRVEESKKKYLARVKTENDNYLKSFYSYIDELNDITSLTLNNQKKDYISKTSRLKLRVVIDGYEVPQIFLDFHPSQKEPVLETLKFKSTNAEVFFDKKSMLIGDYNLATSKIISFNLLDSNSEINIKNFEQMLNDGTITVSLKWFYEPESFNISGKAIKELQEVFNIFQKINQEYKNNEDKIYTPKHVK